MIPDTVLISSSVKSRHNWPLGRITKLLTGDDGKTRFVQLRRAQSVEEETYPICLLHPLELSLACEDACGVAAPPSADQAGASAHVQSPANATASCRPPIREAAKKCLVRLKEC